MGFFCLINQMSSLCLLLFLTFELKIHLLKNTVFTLLFSLFAIVFYGQSTPDSTKTEKVKKLNEFYKYDKKEFLSDSINYGKLDTTFSSFFYYNPQFHNFKINLGNNGTAQKDLTYSPISRIGFKTKMDQINDFRFDRFNTNYFHLTQPFAKVSYINGAQKEEGIDIVFSQNINSRWNMGIEYKKVSSVGFYERQRANINSFKVFQSFKSKNNRYGIIANLNYNDSYNQENGGITSDSIFTEATKSSRQGVPINFNNARNLSRNQEFYVKQFLNFGEMKITHYIDENDSLYSDSVISKCIIPVLSPFHEFTYNNKEFGFEDNDTDPDNYALGTVGTNSNISDANMLLEIDNNLGLRWIPFKNKKGLLKNTNLSAYFGFQYLEYYQKEFHTSVNLTDEFLTNNLVGASISNEEINKNHFSASFSNVTSGFDKGDQIIRFYSSNKIGKFKLNLSLNLEKLNPNLVYRKFKSTTYSWDNSLNLIDRTHANVELEITHLKFKIGGNYDLVQNHTYFNSASKVRQYRGNINLYQSYLTQSFKVWKFHLNLNLRYQYVDQIGIINIPEILTYSSLYFETKFFKKEMLFRIGADLYLASNYTADSYNPIIRQFQSQTNTTINSYPWMDAYLMVKVDRTYFFTRMSNVLEGSVPYNYFAAPGYPMADRAFKFGIKWEFIN